MTVSDATVVFPNNVVNLVYEHAALLDPDTAMFRRPLRNTDGSQAIGVFAAQWVPNEESYEIGTLRHEPTMSSYLVSIQCFIADFDEERGLASSSVLSTMVRTMLFRNDALGVALRALSVVMEGSTERTRRYSVRTQRFNSNEIDGQFLYLSTLEFWLETETT